MKKIISFLLVLFCYSQSGKAQSELFSDLRKIIFIENPDLLIEDHLIAFNVWSLEDAESRAVNVAFEKTFDVYEHARLKGGQKGLLVILFNVDELSSEAVISLQKDGVTKLISVPLLTLNKEHLRKLHNGIYDANGQVIASDLPAQEIFKTVNQLITR